MVNPEGTVFVPDNGSEFDDEDPMLAVIRDRITQRDLKFQPPFKHLSKDSHGYFSAGEFISMPEIEGMGLEIHGKVHGADIHGITTVGGPNSKYKKNEDILFLEKNEGDQFTIAIFDGAGGSGAGRLASAQAALELSSASFSTDSEGPETMQDLLARVDRKTTYGYSTGVIVRASRLYNNEAKKIEIGAAGDSKVMTVRKGQIMSEGTTKLQNGAQEAVDKSSDKNATIYNNIDLNKITGGFGLPKGSVKRPPEVKEFNGEDGDIIVGGSDGLWDVVSEYEILKLASESQSAEDLQVKLFNLAYDRNNSEKLFNIVHKPGFIVEKRLSYSDEKGLHKRGDNITIFVIKLDNF